MYLNIKKIMEITGESYHVTRKKILANKIPAQMVGMTWIVSRADLDKVLAGEEVDPELLYASRDAAIFLGIPERKFYVLMERIRDEGGEFQGIIIDSRGRFDQGTRMFTHSQLEKMKAWLEDYKEQPRSLVKGNPDEYIYKKGGMHCIRGTRKLNGDVKSYVNLFRARHWARVAHEGEPPAYIKDDIAYAADVGKMAVTTVKIQEDVLPGNLSVPVKMEGKNYLIPVRSLKGKVT